MTIQQKTIEEIVGEFDGLPFSEKHPDFVEPGEEDVFINIKTFLKQALRSYAAWVIEEGRQFDACDCGVLESRGVISLKEERCRMCEYKQNMHKLIEE